MSDILDAVYEMAEGLHKAGGMDKITLRQLEALCVPKIKEYSPQEIKAIRDKMHMSRTVFAALLNVGASTVDHWERGLKKPSGPSLRLLDVVDRRGVECLLSA